MQISEQTLFDYSNTSRQFAVFGKNGNRVRDISDNESRAEINSPGTHTRQVQRRGPTFPKDVPAFVPVPAPRAENTPGFTIPTNPTPENLKTLETVLEVDGEVSVFIDRQMIELQGKVDSLEAQFDVCIHFSRQLEEKYKEIHFLMRGVQLAKLCKSSVKVHQRLFYYCPLLEAVCWKKPGDTSEFGSAKKCIPLRDIKSVMAGNLPNLRSRRGSKFNAVEVDTECLLTIESHEGRSIDVVCSNVDVRNKWAKVLNMLICETRSKRTLVNSLRTGPEYELFEMKMMEDITTSKTMIEDLKRKYHEGINTIRRHFLDAAKKLAKNEVGRLSGSREQLITIERRLAREKEKQYSLKDEKVKLEEELLQERLKFNEVMNELTGLKEDQAMLRRELASLIEDISKTRDGESGKRSHGNPSLLSPSPMNAPNSPEGSPNGDRIKESLSGLMSELHRVCMNYTTLGRNRLADQIKDRSAQQETELNVLTDRFNKILQQNSSLTVMLKEANQALNVEREQNEEYFNEIQRLQNEIIKGCDLKVPNADNEKFQQLEYEKNVLSQSVHDHIQRCLHLTQANEQMAKLAKVFAFWLIVTTHLWGIDVMTYKERPALTDLVAVVYSRLTKDARFWEDIKTISSFDCEDSIRYLDQYIRSNDASMNYIVKMVEELLTIMKTAAPKSTPPQYKYPHDKENSNNLNHTPAPTAALTAARPYATSSKKNHKAF